MCAGAATGEWRGRADQLMVVDDRPGAFYAGKRAAARYFFSHELPSVYHRFDLLESLDTTLVDVDDEWL